MTKNSYAEQKRNNANTSPRSLGVSRRALVISFCLLPLNTLFLVRGMYALGGIGGVGGPLFGNVITGLLALSLCNRWLTRRSSPLALKTGELVTIYTILGLGTALVGGVYCTFGHLPAVMTYPFWFNTPENRWDSMLWPYLPTWLTVRDHAAIEGFWTGETSAYNMDFIRAWATPAFWWTTFIAALLVCLLCLNSLVRKRWEDEEKLAFPFVTVPLQLAEESFGLFRAKVWWIGLGLSFGLTAWNALAQFLPFLPGIPLSFDWYAHFVRRWPWANAVLGHWGGVTWQPAIFGLCFLTPTDLLLSIWVFGRILILEEIISYSLGWSAPAATGVGFPYTEDQICGGAIGIAIALLWLDRRYFLQVIRRTLGLQSSLREEGQEAMSYRTAVLGALLGASYCWWFWARTGVPGWIVLAFLGIYFSMSMVVSRVRAQIGSPEHEVWDVTGRILRASMGTMGLGPRTAGMFTLLTPFLMWAQNNHPGPVQIEAFKMAEGGRLERRRIAVALAVTAPLVMLLYFWAYMHFGYQLGMGTAKTHPVLGLLTRGIIENMDSAIRQPAERDLGAIAGTAFGFVFVQVMLFLKLHFAWWPLHPLAFPICNTWPMHFYSLAIIVTWLIKTLLMHYGGLRAHRAALPFFLGLLVGDFAANLLRAIFLVGYSAGL